MLKIRKYIALIIVFLPLFLFKFIASNFIIEEGNAIYAYVPIESDVIVEVNTRNFIKEIAYQRFFEEEYFINKVYPDPTAPADKFVETGINYFDRVVVFRETWPNEKIWSLLISYTDETKLKQFADKNFPEAHLYFTPDNFVLIQLSHSENQDKVGVRLNRIANKEATPITERIDIRTIFPRDKEVNCYFSPRTTNPENQIIDGNVSLDFLDDHIAISGKFVPISDFNKNETIKYAMNEEVAFSMRSSLNLFHSLYWFSDEKLENLPKYEQMAFDYNGVNMFLEQYDSPVPFSSYPDMQLRFDISEEPEVWQNYFDELTVTQEFRMDTVMKMIHTPQGACFSYNITNEVFELKKNEVVFDDATDDSTYLEFHLDTQMLFDNTMIAADPADTRDSFELNVIIGGANSFLQEVSSISIFSDARFKLTKNNENLRASGKVELKEKNGNAMIECLFLGKGALSMLSDY